MTYRRLIAFAALGAVLAGEGRASELDDAAGCAAQVQPEAKKKGLGLGGLLGAAKRAGVGNFLGRGIIPEGGRAKAAAEVAGKAIDDAATRAAGEPGACRQAPQESQQREWRAID